MDNRRIVLKSRPVGIPQPDHFAIETIPVAAVGHEEILIKNLYLSVDPAQRGYVNEENNYVPAVKIGEVMRSLAVACVVESRDPRYQPGDYLYGWFGWQTYCVCRNDSVLRRVDPDQASLSAAAGVLGINGLTASLALEVVGKPRPGDTLVVTAAAGAVGAIVGQLAKLAGCRTIAIVGSNEKGAECLGRFGYDAFINYRGSLETELHAACPHGVDIFFDNVAGTIADLVRQHMAPFGRIIQCGTMAIPSWSPLPLGPRVERDILTRRLKMEGFVIFDHVPLFDSVAVALANLLRLGKLEVQEDIENGLECAPRALVDVYAGLNRGKKLIKMDS